MGGAMAFHRHFVERDDFELFVASDDPAILRPETPYRSVFFRQPAWLDRMCRTRLSLWAHSYKHLVAGRFVPREVMAEARRFHPDLVLTIAGSWNWTALMARHLARRLGVPLAGSFNDWFDYSIFIHPLLHARLERKFRAFYRSCDLALCTCEGMREELGPHPNAYVLYPLGAPLPPQVPAASTRREAGSTFVAVFAGNLGNWYGPMLEQLVQASRSAGAPVEFRFYGSNPSWSREFDRVARAQGIFRGQVPFAQLRHEAANADGLLLLMGFGDACAQIERTSFKTKFLDYVSIQKPILLWGPAYCSAMRYAREFDSAECCTSAQPEDFLRTITRLAAEKGRQGELVAHAHRMSRDRFNPETIHRGLVEQFHKLVAGHSNER
jgi:hypothetical protein